MRTKNNSIIFTLGLLIVTLGFIYIVRTINVDQVTQVAQTPVQKGAYWFMSQWDTIDPASAIYIYQKIFNVVSDKEIARMMKIMVKKEQLFKLRTTGVTINEADSKYKDWTNLQLTALDLINEQCSGKDISTEVTKLNRIYLTQRDAIRAEISKNQTEVLISLYLLKRVGINDEDLIEETIKTIKMGAGGSRMNIYGLTHVVITDSDYYSRYLDPIKYEYEINIVENILSRYSLVKNLSLDEIDMLSEVIMSHKLLRQGDSKDVELISQKIIDAQNEDGSWGAEDWTLYRKAHTTLVATMALADWPDNLRDNDVYCLSN